MGTLRARLKRKRRVRPRDDPRLRPRRSERFYDTVLATLGLERPTGDEQYAEWGDFSSRPQRTTSRSRAGSTSRSSRRRARSSTSSGARADAGYRDDGAPGPRPGTRRLLRRVPARPDGNSAEAVHHGAMRETARSTTSGSASPTSTRPSASTSTSRRTRASALKRDGAGSRAGRRARRLVLARRRTGRRPSTSTSRSRRRATPPSTPSTARSGAGYRDNGAPGERPDYHPGYYGAFVLDPDGNNVELVNHNRPEPEGERRSGA